MKIKPTHYKIQVRIFEMAGCVYVRTKGDHLIYHYPGAIRPVVIPMYKEVPAFVIKNNMRVIGMTREKFSPVWRSTNSTGMRGGLAETLAMVELGTHCTN